MKDAAQILNFVILCLSILLMIGLIGVLIRATAGENLSTLKISWAILIDAFIIVFTSINLSALKDEHH